MLEILCFPTWDILSNRFSIAYKLNFIAIGYRQDLCKFKNYHFTKYLVKLGVVVCVFVCFGRRGELKLF